jgi:hypothetical protein
VLLAILICECCDDAVRFFRSHASHALRTNVSNFENVRGKNEGPPDQNITPSLNLPPKQHVDFADADIIKSDYIFLSIIRDHIFYVLQNFLLLFNYR